MTARVVRHCRWTYKRSTQAGDLYIAGCDKGYVKLMPESVNCPWCGKPIAVVRVKTGDEK